MNEGGLFQLVTVSHALFVVMVSRSSQDQQDAESVPGAWIYGKGRDLRRLVQAAESLCVWAPSALADSTEAEKRFPGLLCVPHSTAGPVPLH